MPRRGQHANPGGSVYCSACRHEIEGCTGVHGDWMHCRTRSEFCADGVTLARPETPAQAARLWQGISA